MSPLVFKICVTLTIEHYLIKEFHKKDECSFQQLIGIKLDFEKNITFSFIDQRTPFFTDTDANLYLQINMWHKDIFVAFKPSFIGYFAGVNYRIGRYLKRIEEAMIHQFYNPWNSSQRDKEKSECQPIINLITKSMNKYFKKWVEEFIVSRKQAFDVLLQSIKNQLESERREQQKIEAKKQVIKNNRRLIYEQLVFMEKEQTELQNLNSCHLE
ncbi:MAG: hypothetical protein ACOYMW_06405 [Candidatus Competibacteraceae bacterium]